MTRLQLEHIIGAAAAIANDPDIVVVGSQAVLGEFPDAPEELLVSMDADVYPRAHPELSDLIDGSIGEGSPFQSNFGYFAHGVGPETAVLPAGWESRLIRVENANTLGARSWCPEAHDLAISKYVAGRAKDLEYTAALMKHGMVRVEALLDRLEETNVDPELRQGIRGRIHRPVL